MYKKLIFLFLSFFTLHAFAVADIVVETSLDSTTILIGQQVNLHAKVTAPKGTRVIFPEYAEGTLTEGVEVLECSKIDTTYPSANQWCLERAYLLTSFDSAVYELPALEVLISDSAYRSRNNLMLKVNTVEVDTLHPDSLHGNLDAPINLPFKWDASFSCEGLAAGSLSTSLMIWVLLLAFVVCLCRLLKHEPLQKRITLPPPPPAHKVAVSEIEKLKSQVVETEEGLKEYYDRLTQIVRTYIESRFQIDAREMTTAQLLHALAESENEVALHEVRELFETADLVKFAKMQTSTSDNECSMKYALEYVEQTKDEVTQPERIVKVINVNRHKRAALITLRWVLTILTGLSTLALSAWVIYTYTETYL